MMPLQRKPTNNHSQIEQVIAPIETTAPGTQAIAVRAYELWLERGCPHGSPEEDWYRAELEYTAAGSRQPAKRSSSAPEPRSAGGAW
jgi:hypothetical protein